MDDESLAESLRRVAELALMVDQMRIEWLAIPDLSDHSAVEAWLQAP